MINTPLPEPSRLIHIVEDSPTQREMLRHMLEKHNFCVAEATNGQEGLALLKGAKPLAVITDIDMPEMDGYTLCRRIKEDPALQNIPVILLTSLSDPENVIMGLECGADYFITKPCNEDFLFSRIQHILDNDNTEQERVEQTGLEISFRGRKYVINSDRPQIVTLLLSTYETAIQKNQELAAATLKLSELNEQQEQNLTELESKNQQLLSLNTELELQREMAHEATRQAEKANQAKSEFLSSMSHELRSPLNAILGFAQLMESDSPPPPPAQKESISQILQAGWHLLKLINEILDLAKIESNQTVLTSEPVSIAEIMLECQGMIEQLALQRGIRMTFPCFAAPCFIMADRTRLKQVLINLVSNAIKYNVDQGTVEVCCSEQTPGRMRIRVVDSGAGMDPEQVGQLFQAFNRLGQEAGSVEGTGIGLVVAKRLIELMGGIIGVESTPGTGSTFWFELNGVDEPRLTVTEADKTPAPPLHIPPATRQYTVLYVEDNTANLQLVEQIIARHPEIHLLTALNGQSGIEIALTALPDVILMDINMPGISGFEALHILRSNPATAHIPVIAVTANAMVMDVEKGRKAGFFGYITKPIKVDEFMASLDMVLEYSGS